MKRIVLLIAMVLPFVGMAQLIEVGTFEGRVYDLRWGNENHAKNYFITYENRDNDSTVIRCYRRGNSKWRKTLELSFYDVRPNDFTMLNGEALILESYNSEFSYTLYDSMGMVRKIATKGSAEFYDFEGGYMMLNSIRNSSSQDYSIVMEAFDTKTAFDVFAEKLWYGSGSNDGIFRLKDYVLFRTGTSESAVWSFGAWGAPVKLDVCDECYLNFVSTNDSFIFGYATGNQIIKSDGTLEGTTLQPFFDDATVLNGAGSWIIYLSKGTDPGAGRGLSAYNVVTKENYELVKSKANSNLPYEIFEAQKGDFFFDEGHLFWKAPYISSSKHQLYEWDLNLPNTATKHEWDALFYTGQANDGFFAADTGQNVVSLYDYERADPKWINNYKIDGSPTYIDFYEGDQNSLFIATTAGSIYELDHTVEVGKNLFKETQLSLYPNPASHQVQVESPKAINSFSIHSLSGKELLRQENVNSHQVGIDLSSFQKGIYLITVIGADYTTTEQLVVE